MCQLITSVPFCKGGTMARAFIIRPFGTKDGINFDDVHFVLDQRLAIESAESTIIIFTLSLSAPACARKKSQ